MTYTHIRCRDAVVCNGGDKSVAAPGQRLNVARRLGMVAERGPQIPYAVIDALLEDECLASRHRVNVLPRDHLARSVQQKRQQL